MKKSIQRLAFGLIALTYSLTTQAQCPVITCPANVIDTNTVGLCEGIVTFTSPIGVDPCAAATFSYTGLEQTFVVPAGITSITVDAYGAQGGANWVNNTNYGGYVQADYTVVPGSTIYIYVGEQPTGVTGGWNGGGDGESGGAGGGGASDIRIGGNTWNERVIVAGGGGGGGNWNSEEIVGGAGGGLIGGAGYRDIPFNLGGDPGTQTTSGNGTCNFTNNPICTGGFGYGGAPSSCGCEGYGGGAGYYGGAGSGNCRGGGGGSSYTDPTATNVTHTQGIRQGNGEITITWGGSSTMTQIAGLTSGSSFPIGVTTNTFVYESGGTGDTCSFTVTVVDTELPTVICPSNLTTCEGTMVSDTPVTADNCPGETHYYNLTGATTALGIIDLSTETFNVGTTTVWSVATDAAGNQDSCSFDITMTPLPTVILASFPSDTICINSAAFSLPVGTPASGTYSGSGVSGGNFNPAVVGPGSHWTSYTFTDVLGCINSDSTQIFVDGCIGINENLALTSVKVYPNPTSNFITIDLGDHEGTIDYSLISVEGKVIEQMNDVNATEIILDLSQEQDGVYLLRIEDNMTFKITKIVKH